MNFEYSQKVLDLTQEVASFLEKYLYPIEQEIKETIENAEDRWQIPQQIEDLKALAKEQGLWNLFLPDSDYGYGLSNLEYAPLAEVMGRTRFASEIFNCSAPDTGNMEVLVRYGTEAQKEKWLQPLLEGEIRSAFAMTEPDVASSDATNIQTLITRDGEDYVINGRKWYISGACDPRCEILIVMGKTDPDNENRHLQQSMILVPMNTPGVTVVRPMQVFGNDDAPEGHAEILFENVRVPAENILLGEGRGFEIAQGRLGPGRIHHCMRLIGAAQRALELMCVRAEERVVFGKPLSKQGSVREDIAKSYCEIEQARLLTLKAAAKMDSHGNKGAKDLIAMIKIVAPQMACTVIDRAIQIHGAAGLSQDFFLSDAYQMARIIRLADGPDQVHMMQLGRGVSAGYSAMQMMKMRKA
ncbi:acyl-CoA dehydrogenase [Oleiphilus sp. HI0081]|jgi:acyl-CoA dehydrogenase|uniref:acyl-CoA dehydrogenase family protein n=6 Tax=Oleiphilus TaxID=141450 RepID=UPI0007C34E2E|nr:MULTISPECIES: acyl-CoA dehydrogenase family protein [unclassified Oleiphilus]KZY50761.1 acyl-CoA dehydrogenase [Oleiphilus sp. HI0050]KZY75017.1 acyl-CoA dehydrogenase [Oleiphilus sp. HI0068]KZY88219.1 acyl-CoA dehydrogenase [Oleiphilus sp. HI0069]KZY89022.1 acyl-CoA dehydrogenase [Oleiphilus sp. HI0072]KZZ19466.1 acyl-CoA dehydrogenase [Oleiphilus sp. HI0081]